MRSLSLARLTITLCMGLSAVLLILFSIFSDPNGRLTPDGARYLSLADNILAGNGFTVPDDGRVIAEHEPFAIWPVGYPSAIAAVAWVFDLPVFAASKLLNIMLMLSTMLLISAGFGRGGFALSLVVLFAAYLEVFSFTWSEAPFLFLFVLAALITGKLLEHPRDTLDWRVVCLGVVVFCLFLFRYVGAPAVLMPAAVAVIDLYAGRRRRGLLALIVTGAVTGLILAYLLNNHSLTGHMTGIERVMAPESHTELLRQLSIAMIREVILPVAEWEPRDRLHLIWAGFQAVAGLVVVVWLVVCLRHDGSGKAFDPLTRTLLLTGSGYLILIVAIRWTTAFDGFGFRLLSPGSLLVFLGLFRGLMERVTAAASAVEGFLTAIASASLVATAFSVFGQPLVLADAHDDRVDHYAPLSEGSILIFAGLHAPYLRSDLHIAAPNPFSSTGLPEDSESWQDFINSLDSSLPIFLDMTGIPASNDGHHPSVHSAIEGFEGNGIIQLR